MLHWIHRIKVVLYLKVLNLKLTMSVSRRKLVTFGYICVHVIYILISLFVYGTHFAEDFPLFTVIRDTPGSMRTKEEVSGYMYDIKVSTCFNNSGCSVETKENPAAMDFVVLVLVGVFSSYVMCIIGMTYYLFRPLKRRTRTYNIFLAYVILTYVSFCIVHVLYVELIGKDVGFNWKHLSPTFYVGFVNSAVTAVFSVVFILLLHKRGRYYVEKNGLAYVKYENSKSGGTGDRGLEHRCAGVQNIAMSDMSLSNKFRLIDDESYIADIGLMMRTLWNPENVGFGRDAKGLHHSSINITKVTPIGNESSFQDYLNKKRQIESVVSSLGKKFVSPGKFPKLHLPIQTNKFVKNQSCLAKLLNRKINEYYMFHGTPVGNLEQVERNGIELNKFRFSSLGRGIYFSEDPVKADQYTGKMRDRKDELCCILVCRVLLGNSVIIRRNFLNHTVTSQATSAPCQTCLKPDPGCQCSESTKFDSVIFEGVLFRDFVVYDTCSCFPEFAVMYTRVHEH